MIIIIESGAIYSAGLLCLLVTYAVGSNGQYPSLDAEMPLVGIAFNLIIVRVGLGLAQENSVPVSGCTSTFRFARRRSTTTTGDVMHMPKITTTSHQVEDETFQLKTMDRRESVRLSPIPQSQSDSQTADSSSSRSFMDPTDSKWAPV